jgi:uncharacterized membrane protein
MSLATLLVAGATALAAGVEWVEALTIVLAVGLFKNWRSAWLGTMAGALVLAVLVFGFGYALTAYVPIAVVRTVVGVFLLLFGLRWLHKAILRSAGFIAIHDEAKIFEKERQYLISHGGEVKNRLDWAGVATSFNGVLLEGLEVVFIVIALGGLHNINAAILGAVVAAVLVVGAGIAMRQPLTRVPENAMKYTVGIMLTAFGTFFAGEGIGVRWWNADLVILPLIAVYAAISFILVYWLRRPVQAQRGEPPAVIRVGRAVLGELWGLLVDNGSLAIITVAALLAVALIATQESRRPLAGWLLVAGILAAIILALNGERQAHTRKAASAAAAHPPEPVHSPAGAIPDTAGGE